MVQRKILFLCMTLVFGMMKTYAQDADSVSTQEPVLDEASAVMPKINVMEYSLQSWPTVAKLDSTRFADHMFMQIGFGVSGMVNDNHIWTSPSQYGFSGAFNVGKWFTPVYGARIGIAVSTTKTQYPEVFGDENHLLLGATADFLMDITSLADMKYVYNRPIRIGWYTGVGMYQSSIGDYSEMMPAFRLGAMLNVRVSDAMSFFVEPGMMVTKNNMDFTTQWRGIDIEPSVRFGLNYRVLPIANRIYNGEFTNNRALDNFFVSMGAGVQGLFPSDEQNTDVQKTMGPVASFGVGKWFSPSSAVRFSMTAGMLNWMRYSTLAHTNDKKYLAYFGAQLDYMLNTSAVFGGYNPESPFSLYLIGGLNATLPEKTDVSKPTFGGGVGFQMVMNVTRHTDLFIEPRVNLYTTDYAGGFSNENYDIAPQVLVGLNYYPRLGEERRKGKYEKNLQGDWFYTAGAGLWGPISNQTLELNPKDYLRPVGNLAIGKWFSQYSGVKLGATYGLISEKARPHARVTKLGGLGLYYVLNVTNLLKGYQSFNRFEVVGAVGPEVMYNTGKSIDQKEFESGFIYGGSASLQAMLNFSKTWGMYVEPKLGFYQDNLVPGWAPIVECDAVASLTAGVIYRPQSRKVALPADVKTKSPITDDWFFTGGVGVPVALTSATIRMGKKDLVQPMAVLGIGKWFNPYSGFKLEAKAARISEGYYTNKKQTSKVQTKLLGLGLYYQANLTNLFRGYAGKRNTVELIGSVGPDFYYNSGDRTEKRVTVGGVSAGLQGVINFSDHFGVYIEPRVGLYSDKLTKGSIGSLEKDGLATMTGGIIWRMTQYNMARQRQQFATATNAKLFVELGVGMSTFINSSVAAWEPRPCGQVSIGGQYSPISSWRLTGRVDLPYNYYRPKTIKTGSAYVRHADVELDYMMSIPNLVSGYKPYRWFDVKPYIGVSYGMSAQDEYLSYIPGVHAGIQGSINFSKWISLFVEPKVSLYSKKLEPYSERDADVLASGYAGLRYNFKNGESYREHKADKIENSHFVQLGLGGGAFMRTVSDEDHRFTLNGELAMGKWYNNISALRFGWYQNRISYKPGSEDDHFNMIVNSFHLDYMVHLSNLFAGVNKDRFMDLYGFVGPSLDFSKLNSKSQQVFSGNLGVQIMMNVSKKTGIYIEPMASLHSDKIDGGRKSRTGFEASAKVTLGVVYRFK